MQLLPVNLVREDRRVNIYSLPRQFKTAVRFRTEEVVQQIFRGLMMKILCIACLFEDDKTVLILWQNVENILLFVVNINQILYLFRL